MNTELELITEGSRADAQRQAYGRVYCFCGGCGQPLTPASSGGDDAALNGPRYSGFNGCCEGTEPIYQNS